MVPVKQNEDNEPKPVFTNIVRRVEHRFAAKAEQELNAYRAEQVRGASLAVEFKNITADLKLAVARNDPDNISEEIELQRKQVKADIEETNKRMKKAEAEAAEIIGNHEAAEAQAAERKRVAEEGKKKADTAIMQEELKQTRLLKQLREAKKADLDDERKELEAEKIGIEAELKSVAAELKKSLMDDGEQAVEVKAGLKNTQADLQTKLAGIVSELKELGVGL